MFFTDYSFNTFLKIFQVVDYPEEKLLQQELDAKDAVRSWNYRHFRRERVSVELHKVTPFQFHGDKMFL